MFLLRGHIYILTFNLLWCMVYGQELLCPYEGCMCDFGGDVACYQVPLTTMALRTGPHVQPVISVSLNDNQIEVIPKNGLPSGLIDLRSQNNPIRHIDSAAFNGSASTLTSLQLSGAVFTELPDALLMLDTLSLFDLHNMAITNWNVTILSHLGRTLKHLTLFQVDLKPWPEEFKWLTVLERLVIKLAHVADIPDDAFANMNDSLSSLILEQVSLKHVPKALLQLSKLFRLHLASNTIEHLENIPEVAELDLSHNLLSDADNVVQALQASANSLEILYLSYNQLTSIPNLSNFTALKDITLDHNTILSDSNPIITDSTSKLETLSLSNNQLTFIPNISGFPFLRTLTLSYNKIISNTTSEPQVSAKSLRSLILSDNRLTSLSNLPRSPVLKYLALDNNEISDLMFESSLSDSLQDTTNSLETLILSFNTFTAIPNVSTFSVLNDLQLQFNNISGSTSGSLPSSLKSLNLHNNRLNFIPTVIAGLPKLFQLTLSSNYIFEFNLINIPSQLDTLDLSFNIISRLGENSFPENIQLRVLDLSSNLILRLDKNIFPENCSLQTLSLQSNPLEYIADSAFDNVKELMNLDLSMTFLMNLPLSLSSLSHVQLLSMDHIPNLVCPCPMPKPLVQWFSSLITFYLIKGECGNRKITIHSALKEETVPGFQCQITPAPLEQTTTHNSNSGLNLVCDIRSIIVTYFFISFSYMRYIWAQRTIT